MLKLAPSSTGMLETPSVQVVANLPYQSTQERSEFVLQRTTRPYLQHKEELPQLRQSPTCEQHAQREKESPTSRSLGQIPQLSWR
jgi:hypothetical protein